MILFSLITLTALLLFPTWALEGARNGLLVWFHTILPTLFPFMCLSDLLISTGSAKLISSCLSPFMAPLLRTSSISSYAILIGFITGMPLGARTCASMTEKEMISKSEAQFLLCFCNNASPMYVISIIGVSMLKLSYQKSVLIWLIIIVSSLISGLLLRCFSVIKKPYNSINNDSNNKTESFDHHKFHLESTVETAIQAITRIGAYLILAGTLSGVFSAIPGISPVVRHTISGFIEITTGSTQIATLLIDTNYKKVLICTITAFGGLSGLLQTKSVMGRSGLSLSIYVYAKILTAVLAATLSILMILLNIL